ncbi:DUF5304 domain-containing protein [Streptomyces sp. AA1529]|uniref:DUF5304 domain-containing protein n=1 Tax=Streptomyces sp. AA1529 TaxID=1203257 RepID=UPI003D73545B
MSDEAERPDAPDPDAWATACEEDLTAEKARRRARYGPPPTSAAEELRRLADAVTEKVAEFGKPLAGTVGSAAAQGVAQQLFKQAKATFEPVVERNPQLFDHLAAAGGELLGAYRSMVQESERRWSEPRDANASAPAAGGDRIDVEEAADLTRAADRDARVVEEVVVEPDADTDTDADPGTAPDAAPGPAPAGPSAERPGDEAPGGTGPGDGTGGDPGSPEARGGA